MKTFTIDELSTIQQRQEAAQLFAEELNAMWCKKLLEPLQQKFLINEDIQEYQAYLAPLRRGDTIQKIQGSEFKPYSFEIACYPSVSFRKIRIDYPHLFGDHGLRRAYESLERQMLTEVMKLAVMKDAISREHAIMLRKEAIPHIDAAKLQGKLRVSPISVELADDPRDLNKDDDKPWDPQRGPRMGMICYFTVEELWAIAS